jgi:hypothetical protein
MRKIDSMLQRITTTKCVKCPFGKDLCFGAYYSPHCVASRYVHLLIQIKNKTSIKWQNTLLP